MDPTTGFAIDVASQATNPGPARHRVGVKVMRAKEEQEQRQDEVAPEDGGRHMRVCKLDRRRQQTKGLQDGCRLRR